MTDLSATERRLLHEKLHDLAGWLSTALDDCVVKQMHRTDNEGGHGKRRNTPIPYNSAASDIAHDVHGTLNAWIGQVAIERRVAHPGRTRTPQAARWLMHHLNDLAVCKDAHDAYDEIIDAHRRAYRAVDKPLHRTYQGTCEICNAELWAKRTDTDIVCHACATVIPKADNDNRLNRILETRLFTADELVSIIADRYGAQVKSKTIHDMAYRTTNPIVVRGRTRHRNPLYLAGEVFNRLRERKVIA